MNTNKATHPIYVSHTKEIEQLLRFAADMQYRMECKGIHTGLKYDTLAIVRRKCADLLLRLYLEKNEITYMNDEDTGWIKLIVGYVKKHRLDQAGQA